MANKPLSQLVKDFRAAKEKMDRIPLDLPRIIGKEAENIVKDNFRLQGYDSGNGLKRWKPREKKTNRGYDRRHGVKGTTINSANPILKQTGNLRNAIKNFVSGLTVQVGVDLDLIPYGQIHNEGGTIQKKERQHILHFKGNRFAKAADAERSKDVTIGAHEIKMPQRQFMPLPSEPANPKIMNAVKKKVDSLVKEAMKLFKP